nr:epoxide hydrolase [uncultured bacterium]
MQDRLEIAHDRISVAGLKLHCARAGSRTVRPPLLFLHGFPESWYIWRGLMRRFAPDRLVLAPDMRGYNLSDKPGDVEAYRAKHLIADVIGLLDQYGIGKCVLIGHDWGGIVAWAAALAHPERFAKLVILNAPHAAIFARLLANDPAQQRASGYIVKYRTPEAEAYLGRDDCAELRKSITEPALRAGHMTPEDAAAYLAAWRQPGAIAGMVNYYRAMRMAPPDRKTGETPKPVGLDDAKMIVRVPTLVVWGMQDRFLLPQCLDGLERYVPDLQVVRLADASHWLIRERPAEVERALAEFVRS